MYNKGPFASWVPKPLILLLILLIMFPLMSVGGVYTGNSSDIVGGLGVYSEFISLASNASTVGMAVATMIILRVKMRFRSKEVMAGSAILLALISYGIGNTQSALLVVIGSFFIGFIKMFPLMEMMMPVMFILSPKGDRGRFYAIFYTISICIGQLTAYLMAIQVANSSWEAPYYIMSIIMLIVASLSLIFQHNQRFSFKMPLYQIDWISLTVLATSAMCFNFALTFMKQQNWFNSPHIVGAMIIGLVLLVVLIYRQKGQKRRLIKFYLIPQRIALWHSLILLVFMGVYLASSSIFVQYTTIVLGYTNLTNASLNLWMIPGIICGGILAFIGFQKKWHLKYFIASRFIAFFTYTLLLYLLIQPQMNIEFLYIPMMIKGLGMGVLFIGIWFYASMNLEMNDFLGVIGLLLIVRSFLATAFGGTVISWINYQAQWQSLSDISTYLDSGFFVDGMSIYGTTQINAIIASSKIVLGLLCWFIIPVLVFIFTHHYGRFNYRRVVLFRKIIKGNSIKGYNFF